jgi:hypothetical protein
LCSNWKIPETHALWRRALVPRSVAHFRRRFMYHRRCLGPPTYAEVLRQGESTAAGLPEACHDVPWSPRLGVDAQVHADRPVSGALRWHDLRVIVEGGSRRGWVVRDSHLRGRNRGGAMVRATGDVTGRLTAVAIEQSGSTKVVLTHLEIPRSSRHTRLISSLASPVWRF